MRLSPRSLRCRRRQPELRLDREARTVKESRRPIAAPTAARHGESGAAEAAAGPPTLSTSMTLSPSGDEGDGLSATGMESCWSIKCAARQRRPDALSRRSRSAGSAKPAGSSGRSLLPRSLGTGPRPRAGRRTDPTPSASIPARITTRRCGRRTVRTPQRLGAVQELLVCGLAVDEPGTGVPRHDLGRIDPYPAEELVVPLRALVVVLHREKPEPCSPPALDRSRARGRPCTSAPRTSDGRPRRACRAFRPTH